MLYMCDKLICVCLIQTDEVDKTPRCGAESAARVAENARAQTHKISQPFGHEYHEYIGQFRL